MGWGGVEWGRGIEDCQLQVESDMILISSTSYHEAELIQKETVKNGNHPAPKHHEIQRVPANK